MSRLTKRFPISAMTKPETINHTGFPAYIPSDDQALAELMFVGTFGNTFYATGQHWTDAFTHVVKKMVAQDPEFVAKAAVKAREEGFVRSAPLVALMALISGSPRAQAWGRRVFGRIIRTGDDLRNVVALAQSKQFRDGYGGLARRLVADWLNTHLDEYQAIKYAGKGERLSLRNILRLTHPVPPSPEREAIYRWLVKGTLTPEVDLPQITWLDRLSRGEVDPVSAIESGRLPFEAVMPRIEKADKAVWSALLRHAPYMFLLRSISAFNRAGVWDNDESLDYAVKVLADPNRIHKAMQFPFRYYQAAQVLERERIVQPLINALYDALEISLSNLPDLGRLRVAIAPDVSGSMHGTQVAEHTSAAVIAGIFTGAIWKAAANAVVLPFGTQVVALSGVSPRDSVMTISRAVGQLNGGGTDLSVPIRALNHSGKIIDLFIGLTDSEDWAASGGWHGEGFLAAWRHYQKIAPQAQAVLIQLVPSGTRVAPSKDPSVHYVYGWSDSVLRYIGYVIQGQSLVDSIRSMEF